MPRGLHGKFYRTTEKSFRELIIFELVPKFRSAFARDETEAQKGLNDIEIDLASITSILKIITISLSPCFSHKH